MKAYMSTGNDENRRHRYNASAEFEAECILAETEPGGLTLTAHAREGYGSGLHGWPEGRDALAASLADFLESEAFGG